MSETNHFFLTLVRHGETDSNKNLIIQGHLDSKLNDMGVKQAEQLSQHLDCKQFNLIFSSDLSRALETAKIVVKSDQRIQTDVRLREICLGEFEGLNRDEFKALAAKENFPPNISSIAGHKGCESFQDVNKRVVDFLTNHLFSLLSNGFRVLIVSHGGVIREIIKYMRDDLKCGFNCGDPEVRPPNTSVTEFKVNYDKKGFISADCLKLKDIKHLSGDCEAINY